MDFTKSRKYIIFFIVLLGILTCIELFYLYLQANYNPYALASFCNINDVIDCDGIEKSMLAQVFGIPFAVWGMIIYSAVAFFIFVDKLKNIKFLKFLEVFKNPRMYIAAIGYIALTLSLVLAVTAYIQIKKICLLCVVTYCFDLLIGLIATDFKNGGIINVFKISVDDFISAVKIKKYGISFGICTLVAAAFLTYTSSTFVFVPHLKHQKEVEYFKKLAKHNPYKIKGNVFGDKNAKVTAILFTDYQCPICKVNNVMLSKAVTEVKGVRIEHKNFPLSSNCNKIIDGPFHKRACMYAKYSVAAEKQEKWGEMNDILFTKAPKTEDDIIKFAKQKRFDIDKLKNDANSDDTMKMIYNDIDDGIKMEIKGTPSLFINDKNIGGLSSYDILKKELKDAVKNAESKK